MTDTKNDPVVEQPDDADASNLPDDVILRVNHLVKEFPITKGVFFRKQVGAVQAVSDISFEIKKGETLGLVGESGCGKSTTARSVLRLLQPTSGDVWFRLESNGGEDEIVNVATAKKDVMRQVRRDMQIVFQDPYASLNPRMTVASIIAEPLLVYGEGTKQERLEKVKELLRVVGLSPEHANRYPHEFSGGQRQRIGVARALSLNPSFMVLDEPVSALDVSIQAQVLNLMDDLQDEYGLTYLFIAHDLSVVRHVSERVAVMYLGQIVEIAPTKALFSNTRHPYTKALLSAIPHLDPDAEKTAIKLEGEIPSPINPPPGCKFHTRCSFARDRCKVEPPEWTKIDDEHFVACHFADELSL